MRLTILLLLLAWNLAAQQPAARVEGRVLTPDGRPISKVSVRIEGSGQQARSYAEVTNGSGMFSIADVAPGSYQASAQLNGYVAPNTANLPAGQRPGAFTVAAGDAKTGIEITLIPLGVVSGMVLDFEGDPVPGARVRLMRYRFNNGQMALAATAEDTADDRGFFRIVNVPAGRYYLQANGDARPTPNGRDIRGMSALETNLPTFYPSSGDLQGARPLSVTTATIDNVIVRMVRGRTYTIRGTVERPNNRNPDLQLIRKGTPGEMPNSTSMNVDNTGKFTIGNVIPGNYILFARVQQNNNNNSRQQYARAELAVGNSDTENVALRMTDMLDVQGKMRVEGTTSWTNFLRGTTDNNPNAANAKGKNQNQNRPRIALISADERNQNSETDSNANDGTFQFRNMPAGRYLINVNQLPPGSYVKAVRYGGQDLTGKPIEISSGGELDILLSSKAGSISVTWPTKLEERKAGEAPFAVVAWPAAFDASRPSYGVLTMNLNPTGTNRFQGLAPGDYYVVAFQEVPMQDIVRIPKFLERFTAQAARVAVREAEEATVEPGVVTRETVRKIFDEFP